MEEGQWETICITENEVQSYTVTGNRRTKSTVLVFIRWLQRVSFMSRGAQEACLANKAVRGGGRGCSGRITSYHPLQLLPGHPAGCLLCLWTQQKQSRPWLIHFLLRTIFILEFALTVICSCQGFVGKTSASVVKTTVKIVMDENSSQVINRLLTY